MSHDEHHDPAEDETSEVDAHGEDPGHGTDTDEIEPDSEEGPKTPGWLTALGGALFLGAGVFWLASQPSNQTLDELTASAAPSASAAASAEPEAAPAPPPAPATPPPIASAVASAKGPGKPPRALPRPLGSKTKPGSAVDK